MERKSAIKIFISDIPTVLRDMFSYAKSLILINVACFPAAAKLPNGENAHCTLKPKKKISNQTK